MGGKTLHTKNQNIHFSNSSSSFAESSKFISFFFSCLSFFFTLAISRNFSSSFSTVAPPGGSREQQLVSSNIVMALNLFKSLMDWDSKTHCLFAQLSRQITTEYTSLSSAHSNFPDFFFFISAAPPGGP